jgi:hypothetical protein
MRKLVEIALGVTLGLVVFCLVCALPLPVVVGGFVACVVIRILRGR